MTPDAAPERLLIKRYPNRKLYDTVAKRYVTLEQIEEHVRAGRDVRVIDHESGGDITNVTLSNILVEREKKQESALPRALFTDIIQKSSRTIVDYARKLAGGWFGSSEGSLGTELDEMLTRMQQAGELGKESVDRLRHAITEQIHVNWDRIEGLITARVQSTFARLDLPNAGEVRRLTHLIEQIEARIAEVEGAERGARRRAAAPKRAAAAKKPARARKATGRAAVSTAPPPPPPATPPPAAP
ncbi:MAG: phasin family protein [Planctomycetes bacterium]|nr:phasin family protein [Planctomycetota bacterium]